MKHFAFRRWALGVTALVVFLAGCGASEPPISGHSTESAESWILPQAKNEPLVYVSSIGAIYVFDYPARHLVGKIYDYRYPLGLCSDPQGNVYVSEYAYAELTEYAHGATSPTRTLSDPQSDPRGCAVDPLTGNIAIANNDPGGVAIFPNGTGTPITYSAPVAYPNACAYDASGNLFVDGGSGFALAELPRGSNAFESVNLNKSISGADGITWDGTYLALQDYDVPDAIYRFSIAGSTGTLESTVTLDGPLYRPELGNQFAVHDGKVIMPYDARDLRNGPGKLGVWAYPAGGKLLEKHGHLNAYDLFGVAVSVAPSL